MRSVSEELIQAMAFREKQQEQILQQMQSGLQNTFSCFNRDELQKEGEELIQAMAFPEKQW